MSFSFYAHNDNQLNSIYRQLSRSSQSTPLFWPKCYYSWFFTEEKTLYNILLLRQKLGPKIEDAEVKEYNAIRVLLFLPFRAKHLPTLHTLFRRSIEEG